MGIPSFSEMQNLYKFIIRYEDAVRDQSAALETVGLALGIKYDSSTFRFWKGDHHITSGNQGPISMVKLHQGLNVGNFESKQVYESQLKKLKENPTAAFSDERWKTQLSEDDLREFDRLMGEQNERLGYDRDRFKHHKTEAALASLAYKKHLLRSAARAIYHKLFY